MKDWKEWFKKAEFIDEGYEDQYQAYEARIMAKLIDEGYIEANPKKKRSKSKPVMLTSQQADWLELFDDIWDMYPKKVGKQQAKKSWLKLDYGVALYDNIWGHINSAYISTKADKQFIPNLSTYLNQARWNDEIIKVKPKLLAVPSDDDKLWPFANKHGLKQPGVMNYFEYRNILRKEVQEKQLMA